MSVAWLMYRRGREETWGKDNFVFHVPRLPGFFWSGVLLWTGRTGLSWTPVFYPVDRELGGIQDLRVTAGSSSHPSLNLVPHNSVCTAVTLP